MVKTLKIGILIQHDISWAGGNIYIQNLVRVVEASSKQAQPPVELSLIVRADADPKSYRVLQPLVTKICEARCLSFNFFNRLWWKVGRMFPVAKDRRLVQLAKREQLDFLYPISGNEGISWDFDCPWAAWIPDFQHKYLPDFFFSRRTANPRFNFSAHCSLCTRSCF